MKPPKLKLKVSSALPLFVLTIFSSAFLLFLVQPLIAKQLLPVFGGSAVVWNVCMLFYQALLLCGYLYAHLLASFFSVKKQYIIHIIFLLLSLMLLPIGFSAELVETTGGRIPELRIFLLLGAAIGAPFFFLSASAPLLQRWFLEAGESKENKNPYFLYAASNFGSFLALFAYPFVIEPFSSLLWQLKAWSFFYFLLTLLFVNLGVFLKKKKEAVIAKQEIKEKIRPEIVLKWIVLAFFPSSLMLGLTQYITTDIAPVPMLWIVPLALYLLTFVIAFADRKSYSEDVLSKIFYGFCCGFVYIFFQRTPGFFTTLGFYLPLFFLAALLCHNRLNLTKPNPRNLTTFYLCLSVGGTLGGVFNALLVPLIFSRLIEFQLVLAFTALYFLPTLKKQGMKWMLLIGGLFAAAIALLYFSPPNPFLQEKTLLEERNFYGAFKVTENPIREHRERALLHGSTFHGKQFLGTFETELTAYFAVLRNFFQPFNERNDDWSVAVFGLGAGTVACLAKKGQTWDFFEINPAIIKLSIPEKEGEEPLFTFVKRCAPDAKMYLGDARMEMAKLPKDKKYNVIIMDAFSSDSIPAHLLTKEAFELYFSRLKEGGLIFVHISNRYLDLRSVIANMAKELGMQARVNQTNMAPLVSQEAEKTFQLEEVASYSRWVIVGRTREDIAPFLDWEIPPPDEKIGLWTDDYYNIFKIMAKEIEKGIRKELSSLVGS
ncbi:MAG: fused MFS/spermidine synthase [Alphaproteobacteria bacterium]|nr:fused MFS/spermidine synthase [Alphaproteobacteria bacterium]